MRLDIDELDIIVAISAVSKSSDACDNKPEAADHQTSDWIHRNHARAQNCQSDTHDHCCQTANPTI